MTNLTPEQEAARRTNGEFGTHNHTPAAPGTLHVEPPVTDAIAEYLTQYDEAQSSYEEDGQGSGPDADEAYENWEDFRTDNAGRTYALLEAAKTEIERLQSELSAAHLKHLIPEELRSVIDEDFAESSDEPLLYVPESGHGGEGYFDVIAVVDGETTRKYTQTPEGEIDWGRA